MTNWANQAKRPGETKDWDDNPPQDWDDNPQDTWATGKTTYSNQTKNTGTITNQTPSPQTQDLTLADYGDTTLEEADGTLGNPKTPYSNQTKN